MKNLILIVLIACSLFGNSQETKGNDKMAELLSLSGKWSVKNFTFKNNEWKTLGETISIIKAEHDGKFISERVKYLTGFGEINMITNIGFDSRISKYKLSAMDKEYGSMDIYTGRWNNKEIVFTNLNSDKPFATNDGNKLWFRITYTEIKGNRFTHIVEGTINEGKDWFLFSKAEYIRVSDD